MQRINAFQLDYYCPVVEVAVPLLQHVPEADEVENVVGEEILWQSTYRHVVNLQRLYRHSLGLTAPTAQN